MIEQYFNTMGITNGTLIILGVGILIFLLIAILLEHRTRMIFPDRKKRDDDDEGLFDLFDDDDEEDGGEKGTKDSKDDGSK